MTVAEPIDRVGLIMAYEDGSISVPNALRLFADLIKSGLAWRLQGFYGRAAQSLIDQGTISAEGEILRTDLLEESENDES